MSSDSEKERRSKRLHAESNAINRQVKIAKEKGIDVSEPHRFAKHHAMDCGNPDCFVCANPRKVFKEKTIQERKFEQKEKYDEPNIQSSRSIED
jgi:protein-tyrosine-phosphatase